MSGRHFDFLVSQGHPVGEVIAVNKYLVKVRGLHPVNQHALVLFADGSKGFVQLVFEDHVEILHLGSTFLVVGTMAVCAARRACL